MIKAKNGKMTVKGHTMELINEYQVITEAMSEILEDDGMLKEKIEKLLTDIIKQKFMTEEEKREYFEQELKEAFGELTKLMDELCGREEKGGADNE